MTELDEWYQQEQDADRAMALEKRAEYGSADLRVMASAMREMLPEPNPSELIEQYQGMNANEAAEAYYIEAAIAFYALGKVSRIVGAFSEGRVPGVDSWRDNTVYSMMARRTRQDGGW